ncbi:MAG: lysine 2,3-aminomutase, partial [Janthinobacterium sp.]
MSALITEPFSPKFKPYTRQTIQQARQWEWLPEEQREAVQVVSHVLPFRTNEYVLDQLIDWNNIPDDPIYRLVFPHRDMLPPEQYAHLRDLVLVQRDKAAIDAYVHGLRLGMNPHPAGQMTHNVPRVNDAPVRGLQHKYAQTVLFFPSAGQTCHAYCTFCFRWPQFVGMDDMKFDARE